MTNESYRIYRFAKMFMKDNSKKLTKKEYLLLLILVVLVLLFFFTFFTKEYYYSAICLVVVTMIIIYIKNEYATDTEKELQLRKKKYEKFYEEFTPELEKTHSFIDLKVVTMYTEHTINSLQEDIDNRLSKIPENIGFIISMVALSISFVDLFLEIPTEEKIKAIQDGSILIVGLAILFSLIFWGIRGIYSEFIRQFLFTKGVVLRFLQDFLLYIEEIDNCKKDGSIVTDNAIKNNKKISFLIDVDVKVLSKEDL